MCHGRRKRGVEREKRDRQTDKERERGGEINERQTEKERDGELFVILRPIQMRGAYQDNNNSKTRRGLERERESTMFANLGDKNRQAY